MVLLKDQLSNGKNMSVEEQGTNVAPLKEVIPLNPFLVPLYTVVLTLADRSFATFNMRRSTPPKYKCGG
jgi:hypothetical protein